MSTFYGKYIGAIGGGGGGGGGIQSINADTTAAQVIAGSGSVSVSSSGGTTTISSSALTAAITSINGNTTAAQSIVGSGSVTVNSVAGTTTISSSALTSAITSINSDTTAAQTITGSNNISVSTAAGTTTINGSLLAPKASPTFTGVATFAAGTAALPSIVFTGSSTTGLYLKTTNQLGFSTDATSAGFIDASQAWTIGASGGTQTHVLNGYFQMDAGSGNFTLLYNARNDVALYVSGDTGSGQGGQVRLYGSSHATKANHVEFNAGSTVNGSIDGSGKWTIGASSGTQVHAINGSTSMVSSSIANGVAAQTITATFGTTSSGNYFGGSETYTPTASNNTRQYFGRYITIGGQAGSNNSFAGGVFGVYSYNNVTWPGQLDVYNETGSFAVLGYARSAVASGAGSGGCGGLFFAEDGNVNIGVMAMGGRGSASNARNYGLKSICTTNASLNSGTLSKAAAGYFKIGTTYDGTFFNSEPSQSAAVAIDNGDTSFDILDLYANGSIVMSVDSTGLTNFTLTGTAGSGTATITNLPAGVATTPAVYIKCKVNGTTTYLAGFQ